MESENPGKRLEDILKNLKGMSFSYTFPVNTFKFPTHKQETADEMIARLDSVDETVDAMTSYPTAKRMLDELFSKDK